ncbi:hypothetical protein QUF63_12895 [Anaerolineales bacterium HSG25]|nr:hypothetical protein [Anaerolineales bacterium HSG25]
MINDKTPIELRELIEKVKQELMADHDNSEPLFVVGKVELEISFTVERNMDGGVNFQVIRSGVQKTTSEVQKVTVALEPVVSVEEAREKLTAKQIEQAIDSTTRGTVDIE